MSIERRSFTAGETEKKHIPLGGDFAREVLALLRHSGNESETGGIWDTLKAKKAQLKEFIARAGGGEQVAQLEQNLDEHHGMERMAYVAKVLPSVALVDAFRLDGIDTTMQLTTALKAVYEKLRSAPGSVTQQELTQVGIQSAKLLFAFVVPCSFIIKFVGTAMYKEIVEKMEPLVAQIYTEKVEAFFDELPTIELVTDQISTQL